MKKSIIFMLVFALLFMFLSGVSANETVDVQSSESVSVEPVVSHANQDTMHNKYVKEKVSEQNTSKKSYRYSNKYKSEKNMSDTRVANKNNTNKSTSNQSITKNSTKQKSTKQLTNNSYNRKEIKKLYRDIINLNENDCKKLSYLMNEIGDSDFKDCHSCLIHHNPKKLLNLLETMEDEEYYTIYIMVWDLKHGTLNYGDDNNNNMVKTTSQQPTNNNKGQYQTIHKYKDNYQNTESNNYQNTHFDKKVLDKYLTLNELFDDYFESKISYEKFINGLKTDSYDISDLVLNNDGTISWKEATIPAPSKKGADKDASD